MLAVNEGRGKRERGKGGGRGVGGRGDWKEGRREWTRSGSPSQTTRGAIVPMVRVTDHHRAGKLERMRDVGPRPVEDLQRASSRRGQRMSNAEPGQARGDVNSIPQGRG